MSELNQTHNVGGTIQNATNGQYIIDTSAVLKEAWSYTMLNRFSIVMGMVIVFLISIGVTLLLSSFLGDIETIVNDQNSMMILNLVVTIVTAPFLVGIEMMGIAHSIKHKTKPTMVFSFLSRASWVALASMITLTMTNLGFALLILPGVFLLVTLLPVNQLIVDKNMTPLEALTVCFKTFARRQWINVFSVYAFVFGAAMLCLVPMALLKGAPAVGLGILLVLLSFLIPFYYNVKGIMYREIFGVTIISASKPNSNEMEISNDNTFDA